MPDAPCELLRVSYLELTQAPPGAPPRTDGARLQCESLGADRYLELYRAVGAALRWDLRLRLPRAELEALLGGGSLSLYVARSGAGAALGFCEFDRRAFPQLELTHFGLLPEAQGRGLGAWVLRAALAREWEAGATRIWLHTDTWDHPAALPLYLRTGFRVYEVRYQPPELL